MNTKELKYGQNIENKIYFVKKLDELGIQRKYTGYYLMVELMEILINQNFRVNSYSKQVYPLIAEKFGKTTCTIERNIRSLIKNSWCEDLMIKLNIYFVDAKKPTCREFISLVKNYMIKQIM